MDLLTLQYSQSTGALTDAVKGVVAQGWAGNGEGKNNPEMQEVHSVGPLPERAGCTPSPTIARQAVPGTRPTLNPKP